ncbi:MULTISPECIES: hypothetical protein [Saccharothrix]|uniref:hypothetical protein n=1 Tax=Saccharothrix TaxID=2071 RepID=UPI00095D59D0|nr:hypothetical protein [Saccharothrix sp. CB00851]OKI21467.1 hypothetical protein A6A25_09145 [Saccharothrix sp. CB00851]
MQKSVRSANSASRPISSGGAIRRTCSRYRVRTGAPVTRFTSPCTTPICATGPCTAPDTELDDERPDAPGASGRS